MLLVPNQIGNYKLNLTKTDTSTQEKIDALPGIGFYKVITTTTGSLGNNELVTESNQQWIVIFPWKYLLVGLILIIIIWRRWGVRVKKIASQVNTARSTQYLDSAEIDSFNSEFERIMAKHRDQENQRDS